MLKSELSRQIIALLTIALASIFLYPAVLSDLTVITWFLLILVLLAAFLTLITK